MASPPSCFQKAKIKKVDPMKNLRVTEDFRNENAGIVYTILPPDNRDVDSVGSDSKFEVLPDPVIPHNRDARRKPPKPPPEKPKPEEVINPSLSTRMEFHKHYHPPGIAGCSCGFPPRELIKYVAPETKWKKKKKAEIRERQRRLYTKCECSILRLPSPTNMENLSRFEVESPEISKVRMMPERPSAQSGYLYPEPPTEDELDVHKPRSGIFINVKKPPAGDSDEDMLKEPHAKYRRKKPREQEGEEEGFEEGVWEDFEGEEDFIKKFDKWTSVEPDAPLRIKRIDVARDDEATSLDEKDFAFEERSWEKIPVISRLVQTFRAQDRARKMQDSRKKRRRRRRFKKGTLESHSYTKLKQKVLCEICALVVQGTIHQGDENFSKISRDKQGICMPIAAMCYTKCKCIKRPTDWVEKAVDEVLEVGDGLYIDSITNAHLHAENKALSVADVQNLCYVDEVKVKFQIDPPEINGHIRTIDKRVFNLTKGLTIFFNRHKRALFQTDKMDLAIWKKNKYFYMFDAHPRRKDAYEDPNGKAALMVLENLKSVVTVLLDRTDLGDRQFLLSKFTILKILKRNEDDVPCDPKAMYNVLSDKKAVVNGTFDLTDKCFCFTRNKQALPMAIACLVYARISLPTNWRRKTVDKIMVIGNQLYIECAETERVIDQELSLKNIPAVFTVGPYIIEIFIYANCMADNMYKKNQCTLRKCLDSFLEKNTSAIIQIGCHTIAVWFQRGHFYYFDPYSRNTEGHRCRNGTACVSMNSNLDTLIDTVEVNFDDKEAIFYIHALKVIRIGRDPNMSKIFPKNVSLNDVPLDLLKNIRCRKSKKKAVEKPIRLDFTEHAMKKLLTGEDPSPSITDIQSNLGSLADDVIASPTGAEEPPKVVVVTEREQRNIADLDSPALSETQLQVARPPPMKEEEFLTLLDLDALEMTREEIEEIDAGEEEQGAQRPEDRGAGEEGEEMGEGMMGEGEEDYYFAKSRATSVHSSDLESMHLRMSEIMNTDVSYCYNILPAQELPAKSKHDIRLRISIDEDIQSLELEKDTRFEDRDDQKYQIVLGEKNLADFCGDRDSDYVAPYACVMAVGYANEQPIYKWTKKTINFILKGGCELFNSHQVRHDKIEDYHLEFFKYKMDITLEGLLDTYVGSKVIEVDFNEKALQMLFENYLFTKTLAGIFITKRYSCMIMFKRHLLYLFEVFGCDENGQLQEKGASGPASLMRFKDLESLVKRILENRKLRLPDEDQDIEYTRIVLVKPNVIKTGDEQLEKVAIQKYYNDEGVLIEPEITQSMELAKCSNFIDLPDGSQIIRGSSDLRNVSQDVDLVAPYVCIMAGAVGGKYSVSTWSPDIVDYVLQCGEQLHKKSRYQFLEVAKLEIPRVALGKTDFSLEVNYQFDAPLKQRILEVALSKIFRQNGDWIIIVAQEYSCACYYKNGLYYLYDGYATNEVGLSEGPFAPGFSSFSRFTDIPSLCTRILYNKRKRELPEKLTYSRFVLSTCKVRYLQPTLAEPKPRRAKRKQPEKFEDQLGEDEMMEEEVDEEEEKVQNIPGFQNRKGIWVIEGTKGEGTRGGDSDVLKADHFICICACLTLINTPVKKWDTRKVNKVIDLGNHIHSHAENLEYSEKRTIKNILVGKYFFDIIVKPIKMDLWKKRDNIKEGLKMVFKKRKFCIIQFPSGTLLVYKEDDKFYVFDPYSWTRKINKKESETIEAGWSMYTKQKPLFNRIKSSIPKDAQPSFMFYSFEVIQVRKAPKKAILSHKVMQYKIDKAKRPELFGKPFHEQENWLDIHQVPWSRINDQTANGKLRASHDSKWHNWDVEYTNDLFSLAGGLHMMSKKFSNKNRGKQTLSNLIVAIAMTNIYELSEWTDRILDSILYNGDAYFTECIKDIDEDNYELAMEDLIEQCSIFPYNFKVSYSPAIEGTIFLSHRRKFNMYKALRYFFENYESRCGVIIAFKGERKRLCCFGKTRENEYFMYDCQAMGPPMFFDREGSSYILRCTTLARLLHCIVLTLRGGDFFIYDVETYDFDPVSKEERKDKEREEREKRKKEAKNKNKNKNKNKKGN